MRNLILLMVFLVYGNSSEQKEFLINDNNKIIVSTKKDSKNGQDFFIYYKNGQEKKKIYSYDVSYSWKNSNYFIITTWTGGNKCCWSRYIFDKRKDASLVFIDDEGGEIFRFDKNQIINKITYQEDYTFNFDLPLAFDITYKTLVYKDELFDKEETIKANRTSRNIRMDSGWKSISEMSFENVLNISLNISSNDNYFIKENSNEEIYHNGVSVKFLQFITAYIYSGQFKLAIKLIDNYPFLKKNKNEFKNRIIKDILKSKNLKELLHLNDITKKELLKSYTNTFEDGLDAFKNDNNLGLIRIFERFKLFIYYIENEIDNI